MVSTIMYGTGADVSKVKGFPYAQFLFNIGGTI